MGFTTKQVHAGVTPDPGHRLDPHADLSSRRRSCRTSVDQYLSKGFSYSRSGNPTVQRARAEARGARERRRLHVLLDGHGGGAGRVPGDAVGRRSRDHLRRRVRRHVPALHEDLLAFRRRSSRSSNTANPDAVRKALRANTKLIFTETPANPTLKLTDIARVSRRSRASADSARRRQHVPDAVLTSGRSSSARTSRSTARRSTSTATTRRRRRRRRRQRRARPEDPLRQNATGVIMSPFVAWLTLQGTKTLSLRLERQSANAQAIAEFLETHPKVDASALPGPRELPAARAREKAGERLRRDAVVRGRGRRQAGKKLMDSVKLCTLAENLGSVETLITHPGHDDARRRRAGRAQARRHHGRPRAPVRRASRTSRT